MTKSDVLGLTARDALAANGGVFVWGFSGFGGVVREPHPFLPAPVS